MKSIWAPWRIEYIEAERGGECVLCTKPLEHNDCENLILHRGKTVYIIMNRYPYSNGHLMAVPYRHVSKLGELDGEEKLEIMNATSLALDLLRDFDPDGFNVGINIGRVAGAGIEDHLHFHIVPRWTGDANFMPVIGNVRVMPEYLEQTYCKLSKRLKEILG